MISEIIVEEAVKAFNQIKVGLPWEAETQMGSQIKEAQIQKILSYVEIGRQEGAAVACIIKFKDEVIVMANDNDYGLEGAVWTRDINRAIRVSRAIKTGRMWVNTYNAIPEGAPFGGYKASGIGRETHKVILEHYTQMKNIMNNLSEAPSAFSVSSAASPHRQFVPTFQTIYLYVIII